MPRPLDAKRFVVIADDGRRIESQELMQAYGLDPNACAIQIHDNGVLEISQEDPYTLFTAQPGGWEELAA